MTMQQAIQCPLPAGRRQGWARFVLEVLLWAGPWLAAAALAASRWIPDLYGFPYFHLADQTAALLLLFTGLSLMLRSCIAMLPRQMCSTRCVISARGCGS